MVVFSNIKTFTFLNSTGRLIVKILSESPCFNFSFVQKSKIHYHSAWCNLIHCLDRNCSTRIQTTPKWKWKVEDESCVRGGAFGGTSKSVEKMLWWKGWYGQEMRWKGGRNFRSQEILPGDGGEGDSSWNQNWKTGQRESGTKGKIDHGRKTGNL